MTARQYVRCLVAVTAVVLREVGRALMDVADAMDAASGEETANRCPAVVPDYLTSTR